MQRSAVLKAHLSCCSQAQALLLRGQRFACALASAPRLDGDCSGALLAELAGCPYVCVRGIALGQAAKCGSTPTGTVQPMRMPFKWAAGWCAVARA